MALAAECAAWPVVGAYDEDADIARPRLGNLKPSDAGKKLADEGSHPASADDDPLPPAIVLIGAAELGAEIDPRSERNPIGEREKTIASPIFEGLRREATEVLRQLIHD